MDLIKDLFDMKTFKEQLEDIAQRLEAINAEMNEEERVYSEELADRKRLGLTGDAALKHYNDWMDLHGMSHLKVSNLS